MGWDPTCRRRHGGAGREEGQDLSDLYHRVNNGSRSHHLQVPSNSHTILDLEIVSFVVVGSKHWNFLPDNSLSRRTAAFRISSFY